MNKLFFSDYTDLNQKKFKDVNDIKTFTKICIDTYKNKLQNQSIEDANEVIRTKFRDIAGISETANPVQIKKALKRNSVQEAIFEIIETTLDDTLVTGWTGDLFFRKYVEFKNVAIGETNLFDIEKDGILVVNKAADGHHSIERQRISGRSQIRIATA